MRGQVRAAAGLAVLAVLAILGAAVLAACGGDDDPAAAPEETPTPGETVVASSPSSLQSYRYTVEIRAMPSVLDTSEAPDGLELDREIRLSVQGERVNPDSERVHTVADLGFIQIQTETVRIGDRRWLREGTRPWDEGDTSALDVYAATDYRPAAIFAEDDGRYEELARALEGYPWTEEDVRGVPARRFDLDEQAFHDLFQARGALPIAATGSVTASIWLERDRGVPVRLHVVGVDDTGEEIARIEVELFDLDAEEIEVEPPV